MAKDITLKSRDGGTTYYPKTVSDLVYDNSSGQTVKNQIDTLGEELNNMYSKFGEIGASMDQSDLDISDEEGNILVAFRNGHIKTKHFDSENIKIDNDTSSTVGISKRKIKALFIGNSVSQDHITYLPYLLKNTYGDSLDFELAIFYIGGYTIKQYVENVISGSKKAEIFSIAHNTESWTNQNNTVTLQSALSMRDWDVISMEGYYNNLDEDTTMFSTLVDFFQENANKPFELG